MQLKEVISKADWRDFHKVIYYVYAKDPLWIAPLEDDIRKVFTPEKNKTYDQGEARLWVLYNDKQPVGRIAAFIDGKRNLKKEKKEGGIGFFECINNEAAFAILFDAAENYLQTEGIQSIIAPVNFGERDKFWGLLIKGWFPPLYHENYHPFYYRKVFEDRGYQPHEQIFTFGGKTKGVPFERNQRIAKIARARYGLQSRSIRKNKLKEEAQYMADAYNAAFANKPHFKKLAGAQFYQMIKPMKPIMDVNLICIAFADDKAVGFCALMPDLNQSLKFAKGKLSWWKKPFFLFNLKRDKDNVIKGVAFGIHPDYQSKGVFAEMVDFISHVDGMSNLHNYGSIGFATIRGNNYGMLKSTGRSVNAYVERVHLSYQKNVDGSPYDEYESTDTEDVKWGDIPDENIYPTA